MKKIKRSLLASLLFIPLLSAALELNPEEKTKLLSGEVVEEIKWRDEFVWPLVTMRALVPGSPEANMKSFTQFDKHPSFIPDLLVSKVVKTISPTQMHVYAEMKVPWPVNKSTYTTNNVITKKPDGSVDLTWNKVEGKLIKATDGHITFTPYEGKSLMEYQSQIVPDSKFAGMVKNQVPKDVRASVTKIIEYLKSEQGSQNPAK